MFRRIPTRWLPERLRVVPLLGAIALFVMLGSYGDFYNYRVHFGPYLADITPGEVRLWLASVLITLPACWLALQGLAGYWIPWAARLKGWLETATRRQLSCATLFTALGLLLLYRCLRWVLLRDHALTDDETMIRFGGQIIAGGHLSVPKIWPYGTLTELYTVTTEGRIFSMDWPGGLVFAAASQVTRLGPWLYGLFAAGTFVALVITAWRLWGVVGGAVAALLWLVSPMAWTLSLTEHTHVVSRGCVALAILAAGFVLRSEESEAPSLGWGATLGAATGYSIATRPYETVSSLGPLAVYLIWRTVKQPKRLLRQTLVALGAALPLLLAYGAYNYALTGSPFLTPRSVTWATDAQLPPLSVWHRMGQNFTHNWLMLGVWAGGLIGFPLAYLGLRFDDAPSKAIRVALAVGALGQLLTALGHENLGIHIVGPIHYSETATHLLLLMTAGVLELRRLGNGSALVSRATMVVLGGHSVMLIVAGAMYAGSLINIGKVASIIANAVRDQNLHNAVVAAPTPAQIHGMSMNLSGSWQLAHPPADPWLKDDVIYTYLEIPRDTLLTAFPDRKLYVATYNGATMQVTFEEVTKESLALAAKAAAPAPKPPQPKRRRHKVKPATTSVPASSTPATSATARATTLPPTKSPGTKPAASSNGVPKPLPRPKSATSTTTVPSKPPAPAASTAP